jgi:MoaA/NifB/PqqE/SkfB family radical SAM enzyme
MPSLETKRRDRTYVIQGRTDTEAERLAYMLRNMPGNKAYQYAGETQGGDPDGRLLEEFRRRFERYRESWRRNPQYAIAHHLHHESFREAGLQPLCVDIETSAICDLACPFCFRQWIATPDRVMKAELFHRIIDQCEELGVPSVKLNWRGEPLLHPKLPQLIAYAKRAGVLETIINTNAVTLDENKARALIESGLDLMIYSFDGATKQTYERMRVGRFKENRFDRVYQNIRRFAAIREEMGSPFPRTKIQMILTEDTREEQDSFFALFGDCVDDVAVKAYTERGGKLRDLDEEARKKLGSCVQKHEIQEDAATWGDMDGNLYVSDGRLPCEQPYQRLMITHDGRVSMCCYDWGMEYPIGYVSEDGYRCGDRDYEIVIEKARMRARGFEQLASVQMPRRFISPAKRVSTLPELWHGDIINDLRQKHLENRIEEIPVCRRCSFKETYRWIKIGLGNESANC